MNELRFVTMYAFLCILAVFLISWGIYNYKLLPLEYKSVTEALTLPNINPVEIEKNQQKSVLNVMTSDKNNSSQVVLVDIKAPGDSEIPLNLENSINSCKTNFECIIVNSTGWNDKSSLKVSTIYNKKNLWSFIIGKEIPVKTNDRYELFPHMKLNKHARHSNILFQGFNESSEIWYDILKCPYDKNGPVQWTEFSCSVTIPENTTKIRPVLNAGWSSINNTEAVTWFDYLNVTKFNQFIADPNLKSEVVYEGLKLPTSMAFLGPNDYLVLEKDGTVQRIVNGIKSDTALIKVSVAKYEDGGLLGVAINDTNKRIGSDSRYNPIYVYLYFTAQKKQSDKANLQDVGNRVYRYELVNNTLSNGQLLLDLPAGYHHDGGPLLMAPDNRSLYLSVGSLEDENYSITPTKALNNDTGSEPDGSGGILHFTPDGKPINGGILGNSYPLNLYYAYGIRNSFGMAFDPLTGILWSTDNGHDTGDEINMLKPGFNGGWNKVQGIWPYTKFTPNASNTMGIPPDLVTFEGKGKYYSPKFTWNQTVGLTALIFLTTDKLGKEYNNDMFVGDVENGRIYHFKLTPNRTELLLDGPLRDKVADDDNELKKVIFAGDFGLITDLDVGPDGYLYFVVFNEGKVYRIVPNDQNSTNLHH